jgi:hypothetical protein
MKKIHMMDENGDMLVDSHGTINTWQMILVSC